MIRANGAPHQEPFQVLKRETFAIHNASGFLVSDCMNSEGYYVYHTWRAKIIEHFQKGVSHGKRLNLARLEVN
ncbi:MAG: hypothetical protein CMI66_05420 [Pedosphaera sp.]|nr:hypothetical protein [Pedosphaera sp.]HCP38487.1 hypothetical protein [Verrucomicrobiales bacterium]HCZ03046.1 hypothetical protein [Verrucomicrobiales bacterium]